MTVFTKFGSYGYIHHRALNSFGALSDARNIVRENPGRVHIYEGDICWDFSAGREELYFRHPKYVFDRLAAEEIAAGRTGGSLVTIKDLEPLKDDPAFIVVELKVGRGDTKTALEKLLAFMNRHFFGRFWIDGFSLKLLRLVKDIDPSVAVTLHTECVSGTHVLAAAPQSPMVRIVKLADLQFIDGIAVRWRFGPGFMRRAAESVHAARKALLISRIHDLDQFRCSLEWRACAGYVHGDFQELIAEDDRFRQASQSSPSHAEIPD